MPRKKNQDLEAFQDWLVDHEFLADSTACVYASTIRSVLPHVEDLQDEDHLTEVFSRLGETFSRRSMSSKRAAWKRFSSYARSRGVILALPRAPTSTQGPGPLPHTVRAAVHYLTSHKRFKQSQLAGLSWSHVEADIPSVEEVGIRNPFNVGEVILVPREHIEALKSWADAHSGMLRPLVPAKKGSEVTYPARLFRRELRLYRDAAGLEATPRTSSGAAVNQAALAETEAIMAARQGVKVSGKFAPDPDFVPTRSTKDLHDLIEGGTLDFQIPTKQAQEGGTTRGAPGPTEDKAVEASPSSRDRKPVPPALVAAAESSSLAPLVGTALEEAQPPKTSPEPDTCSVCGYPRAVHAEAFGLTDGTISNCAVENGYPEDACQMCAKGCYGRHSFKAEE